LYNETAIAIDIPVYKALHHRGIPIFVRRDRKAEDLENIDFLLEAFRKFHQVYQKENFNTLEEFDAKYMVHFRAAEWLEALRDLLRRYKSDIPAEQANLALPIRKYLKKSTLTLKDNVIPDWFAGLGQKMGERMIGYTDGEEYEDEDEEQEQEELF
jgi:hypothetical protein